MGDDEAVAVAQKQIAEILKNLEVQTGSVVERVELVDIDTTTYADPVVQYQRKVRIKMMRLPGSHW